VGVVVASQNLPRLFLSIPVGIISDRFDRRILLQATNLFGATSAFCISRAIGKPWFGFTGIVVVALMIGIFDVLETNICKPFVYDVVGREGAVNGLAMEQLADKLFGIIGGLAAGVLLLRGGGPFAYVGVAAAYGSSAAILFKAPRNAKLRHVVAVDGRPDGHELNDKPRSQALTSMFLALLRNPYVVTAGIIAFTAEAFAYSSDVLLPVFSRDIFKVDEAGYGMLIATRNAGGVFGLLILATVSRAIIPARRTLFAAAAFGLALMVFSTTTLYAAALGIIFFVGIAWAQLDSLLPAVMQLGVEDDRRGSATSIWSIARGLGPAGQLEIGGLATLIGVAPTLALNGGIVMLIALSMYAYLFHFCKDQTMRIGKQLHVKEFP
jgi:predicted MFS family arabinose efflux permease